MYFVNRSEIEKTLAHMESLLGEIKLVDGFDAPIKKLGLERLVHIIIESMLDVGNMMIDGFIMRDPGSYHDIIDILIDEKVIPAEDEASLKAVVDLRQMIVQDYLEVDHVKIKDILFREKQVLKQFIPHVLTYLDNELGVANAFANESEE